MATGASDKRRKLTRELLVATALDIADRNGLEALSMRRLGAELGVDPMAAYRYLSNKKELVNLVVEAVLQDADIEPDPDLPWQDQYRALVRSHRRACLAHTPAVARLAASHPVNSPSVFRIVEHAIAVLTSAGIPLHDATVAIQTQGVLTSGSVASETFWREWVDGGGMVHLFPPVLPVPELPLLSRAAAAGTFGDFDTVFEFGLDAVIAHLERLLRGHHGDHEPPPRTSSTPPAKTTSRTKRAPRPTTPHPQ